MLYKKTSLFSRLSLSPMKLKMVSFLSLSSSSFGFIPLPIIIRFLLSRFYSPAIPIIIRFLLSFGFIPLSFPSHSVCHSVSRSPSNRFLGPLAIGFSFPSQFSFSNSPFIPIWFPSFLLIIFSPITVRSLSPITDRSLSVVSLPLFSLGSLTNPLFFEEAGHHHIFKGQGAGGYTSRICSSSFSHPTVFSSYLRLSLCAGSVTV